MTKKSKVNRQAEESALEQRLIRMIGDNAFINMVSGLGTIRDKAASGQFIAQESMQVKSLNDIYAGDWIAQRIINKPSFDAIRKGWYFENLTPKQDKAVKALSKKIGLNKVFLRAVALSRLHGWSYILIGERGNSELQDELSISTDDLLFLSVLKRDQCKPKEKGGFLPADLAQGYWDQPEFYEMGEYENKKYIHHSRIIRIECPDPIGDDDGKPRPMLQQVKTALLSHASVKANADSLVYEAKIDVIRIPKLFDNLKQNASLTINNMLKRFTSIATLKGNNGMIILDKDEEYVSKTYSFAGLSDLMREFRVETAGAANIPHALLFGRSTSQLGSTGDFEIRTYYDDVNTMQEGVMRDPLERVLFIMGLSLGFTVDDFGLIFQTLWQMDEKVKSEIERSNSERDRTYLEQGVITEAQVARQLVDDGTYTAIDEAHIKLLESMVDADDKE